MMRIERPETPQWLADNWERWGRQYQQKRDNPNKSNEFTWYKHEGTSVRELLLPLLRQMTSEHCSFCDKRPIGVETIEHFRPKAIYPLESYSWENLFVCCYDCQVSRQSEYDEILLKPDELDYEFSRYFIYDFSSGKIEINPQNDVNSHDYQRAEFTRRVYGLNEHGLPEARKFVSDNRDVLIGIDIERLSYRFIFI